MPPPVQNQDITADPIVITLSQQGLITNSVFVRNADLDQTFDCHGVNRIGERDQGVISTGVTLAGSWLNVAVTADPITITLTPTGSYPSSFVVNSDPITITLGVSISDIGIILEHAKRNWVKWSDIGNLDFTVDRTNIAGERPLDWKGWVYEIKKLGKKVIVYGENGVSVLTPSDVHFGMDTIYRVGVKSKHAITGDDLVHYFIDNKGQLWELSDSLKKLDFSEYLSPLSSPVMSFDAENNLVYICDGTIGFVYSPDSNSLGKGPVNVSGLGSQSGTLYIVAPATVETPSFEICTDIYDFGTRKAKTIQSIELGTDLTGGLKASIDFRLDHSRDFTNIGWFNVTHEGVAYIPCYGTEFKFRVKGFDYEYFELDYIKINGSVHRYNPLDTPGYERASG